MAEIPTSGLFTAMDIYCPGCGKAHQTHQWNLYGLCCSKKCFRDVDWLRTLSICGSEFKPRPPDAET